MWCWSNIAAWASHTCRYKGLWLGQGTTQHTFMAQHSKWDMCSNLSTKSFLGLYTSQLYPMHLVAWDKVAPSMLGFTEGCHSQLAPFPHTPQSLWEGLVPRLETEKTDTGCQRRPFYPDHSFTEIQIALAIKYIQPAWVNNSLQQLSERFFLFDSRRRQRNNLALVVLAQYVTRLRQRRP